MKFLRGNLTKKPDPRSEKADVPPTFRVVEVKKEKEEATSGKAARRRRNKARKRDVGGDPPPVPPRVVFEGVKGECFALSIKLRVSMKDVCLHQDVIRKGVAMNPDLMKMDKEEDELGEKAIFNLLREIASQTKHPQREFLVKVRRVLGFMLF